MSTEQPVPDRGRTEGSGLDATAPELVEDYRCCSLDTTGGGHEGPCGRRCSTCMGTGVCPVCRGDGPELCGCYACDTTGTCPEWCEEGWVSDE